MTLGQVLKSKRLELGKSIEQIATATRIHVKVLSALEEDQYGQLPARAFTRGFIISYCKALQINPEEILRDYHDFLESKYAERPEKDHGHHGYAFEGKEMEQNKRWMVISASVLAFFVVLTLLFFKPQNHRHKEKHKELIAEETDMIAANTEAASGTPAVPTNPEAATATPTATAVATTSPVAAPVTTPAPSATPITTPTATPVATPTATPTPASSPSPSATPQEDPLNKGDGMLPKDVGVKVVFEALEDTLIHYHSDDRKPYSIMLRKGKQLVIKATDVIKVETKNPEQLKYKLNFKNKPGTGYNNFEDQRLELRSDGTKKSFDAGSL